ncbi:serpin family protein [Actinomycetaceae bacterium MB13-C1-2]|nr:serpin family protein [Actinomycetaceae bacterium MB13-C1-2]
MSKTVCVKTPILSAFAVCAMLLAGCSSPETSGGGDRGTAPGVNEADVEPVSFSLDQASSSASVIQATREFGLSVLALESDETLVTSPASAIIALAMLGSGAEGETESQFTELIGAGGSDRDEAVNALVGSLDPFRDDVSNIDSDELPEEPKVHIANQVVLDDQLTVEPSYLDSLKKWFNAGVLETDLGSEKGKEQLDQWVRYNTAGLIEKSAVEPNSMLRLVLQNAVLFAAKWSETFDANNTYEDTFSKSDGSTIDVDFMHDRRVTGYAEADGWKMLELPYGSDANLVARFVLPPEGTAPAAIEISTLERLESELAYEDTVIALPKLDLKSNQDLVPAVKAAGLTDIFDVQGDPLAYISKSEPLFVSLIVQQGRVIMDEEGTIAAAVTEIALEATSAPVAEEPPKEFIADRPYLMFILDKTVGWDLFQILVNDPAAE